MKYKVKSYNEALVYTDEKRIPTCEAYMLSSGELAVKFRKRDKHNNQTVVETMLLSEFVKKVAATASRRNTSTELTDDPPAN